MILLAILTLGYNWDRFVADSDIVFSPNNWVWMTAVSIALKIVHEMAHAIVCQAYGGEVKELGLVWILFAPWPDVDVTSSWRFPSKCAADIHVAAAACTVELLVAVRWLP